MLRCLLSSSILLATSALAAEPSADDLRQLKLKLMIETKMIAVTELTVPANEYQSDGDAETLEVVFLAKRKDGPNRVSDDGEVIFLYNASDKQQQALIEKAFDIRARRKLSET